tara:strand:- start:2784 stop:3761 length:978 start_codon:yes stop_codon:yes gene_type:complete
MNELLNYFPREIANPYRVKVYNKEELFSYANKWNRHYDCYYSLYDNKNYYIDKAVYDIDSNTSFEVIKKFHKFFVKEDIKHLIVFSGNGFHFYFFTTKYKNLKKPKEALRNVHLYFIKVLNLTYGSNGDDVESKLIGDIKRIIRIPNTYNKKANLYCIPLSSKDLEKNIFFLRDKAKSQNFEYIYYGSKYVNLSKFDSDKIEQKTNSIGFSNVDIKYISKFTINDFHDCVKKLLLNPKLVKNQHRFFFAKYCREKLVSPEVCDKFAKKYWDSELDSSGKKTKYQEFVEEKQIQYAYKKDDTFFPDCDYLKTLDLCGEDCKRRVYK